jgi:hypothetical protein
MEGVVPLKTRNLEAKNNLGQRLIPAQAHSHTSFSDVTLCIVRPGISMGSVATREFPSTRAGSEIAFLVFPLSC